MKLPTLRGKGKEKFAVGACKKWRAAVEKRGRRVGEERQAVVRTLLRWNTHSTINQSINPVLEFFLHFVFPLACDVCVGISQTDEVCFFLPPFQSEPVPCRRDMYK
jgi:hypothetical protein